MSLYSYGFKVCTEIQLRKTDLKNKSIVLYVQKNYIALKLNKMSRCFILKECGMNQQLSSS